MPTIKRYKSKPRPRKGKRHGDVTGFRLPTLFVWQIPDSSERCPSCYARDNAQAFRLLDGSERTFMNSTLQSDQRVQTPAIKLPKETQAGIERRSLNATSLQELIREILVRLGEDPDRDGLLHTPERMERSMRFLTNGNQEHPEDALLGGMFDVSYDEMVIVRDIEMFSLCEHHLLPFLGKVHVAYIPRGKVIGLSKVPRLVDVLAHRLQVQERLTTQIADAIESAIHPRGVGVVIEARHLCMMMRGVEKQHSSAITSSMRGAFRNTETRNEFLTLIRTRDHTV